MNLKIFFLIVLVISGLEIFTNIFTKVIVFIASIFKKNFKLREKPEAVIKMLFVVIFLTSVIYYMTQMIKFLADLFGISLNMSIFDIFR